MKKILAYVISALLFLPAVQASHLIGGELTWECVTSGTNKGKFIFTLKKYRSCAQGSATGVGGGSIINPLGGNIAVSWVSQGDISPECYDPPQEIDCFGGTAAKQLYAIEEFVFRSAPVALVGTPASTGSMFYNSSCCRPTVLPIVPVRVVLYGGPLCTLLPHLQGH